MTRCATFSIRLLTTRCTTVQHHPRNLYPAVAKNGYRSFSDSGLPLPSKDLLTDNHDQNSEAAEDNEFKCNSSIETDDNIEDSNASFHDGIKSDTTDTNFTKYTPAENVSPIPGVYCKYRSARGEPITYSKNAPAGYRFVPTGNPFITRNCRKLAENLVVVYRVQSQRRSAGPIGLIVPENVYQLAKDEADKRREKTANDLSNLLSKKYPRIPSDHKEAVVDFLLERYIGVTKSASKILSESESNNSIYVFVREKFTGFHEFYYSSTMRAYNAKEKQKANEETDKIFKSWSG
ncbi:hypothetical protein K3495_g11610 [Podosphaera aphanis]|nr:hypothetical protein K3495_g11610 [Podosphaera aphanis]